MTTLERLTLQAETAADLMRSNPVSIRASATVREAVALLTDRGFSAAPVIDEAGHPVGVLSRADILVHDRERVDYIRPVPDWYTEEEGSGGSRADNVTLVRDIMTPVVFSVAPDTPAERVVEQMVALKVHRLFVVDAAGILVGVISTLDVLRRLRA